MKTNASGVTIMNTTTRCRCALPSMLPVASVLRQVGFGPLMYPALASPRSHEAPQKLTMKDDDLVGTLSLSCCLLLLRCRRFCILSLSIAIL